MPSPVAERVHVAPCSFRLLRFGSRADPGAGAAAIPMQRAGVPRGRDGDRTVSVLQLSTAPPTCPFSGGYQYVCAPLQADPFITPELSCECIAGGGDPDEGRPSRASHLLPGVLSRRINGDRKRSYLPLPERRSRRPRRSASLGPRRRRQDSRSAIQRVVGLGSPAPDAQIETCSLRHGRKSGVNSAQLQIRGTDYALATGTV